MARSTTHPPRPARSRGAQTLLVGVLLLVAGSAAAQSLTLAEALQSALSESIDLEQSRVRTTIAATQVDRVLDSTRPRLSVSADPAYGLVSQRGTDFASIASVADFPPEPTTTVINSTGATLSLQQALPTNGLLSTGIGTTLSATTAIPDTGDTTTSYSFRPAVSLSVSQPLFVDGSLVDTEEPRLVLEQAERGVGESSLTEERIRRQIAANVVRTWAQLDGVRRAIDVQLEQRRLLAQQLEQAEIRREQGQGSRQESFTLQVQINRTDDAILQTRLSARELELQLGSLTGLAITSQTRIEPLQIIDETLVAALAEATPRLTLDGRAAATAVERAATDLRIARKQERATGQLSLSLTPRYEDSRESPDSLGGAFTDYFGEGAGVDVSLSLGFTVALGEDAAREREVRLARLAVELAEFETRRVDEDRLSQLEIIREREQITEQRVELLRFEIEFERAQLANELELIGIGASTELTADQIRSTIAARENELADLETQRFLQRVDRATLLGLDIADLFGGAGQ